MIQRLLDRWWYEDPYITDRENGEIVYASNRAVFFTLPCYFSGDDSSLWGRNTVATFFIPFACTLHDWFCHVNALVHPWWEGTPGFRTVLFALTDEDAEKIDNFRHNS